MVQNSKRIKDQLSLLLPAVHPVSLPTTYYYSFIITLSGPVKMPKKENSLFTLMLRLIFQKIKQSNHPLGHLLYLFLFKFHIMPISKREV